MNRKMLILVGAAAIGVGVENFLYFRPESAPPPSSDSEESAEAPAEGAAAALDVVAREKLEAYLASLPEPSRNPFLTLAEADALAQGGGAAEVIDLPLLEGTLTSRERRVAWLDGHIAREGDRVRGFELLRIEPRAVWMGGGAEPLRLELREAPNAAVQAAEAELEAELSIQVEPR